MLKLYIYNFGSVIINENKKERKNYADRFKRRIIEINLEFRFRLNFLLILSLALSHSEQNVL